MANKTFDKWFDKALKYEGKVNEDVPGDAGGPTRWGITLGRLATIKGVKTPKRGTVPFERLKAELYSLTADEIKAIYRRDYWDAVRADELPAGVDFAVADFGLNSGPSRAVTALQRLCGNRETGRMDDETVREAGDFDRVELIMLYCDERTRFLNAIVEKRPNQRKFLKGWLSRVGDVKRSAIALAEKDETPAPVPVVKPMPKAEPVEPPAPSVAKEVVKSTSGKTLLTLIVGWVADAVFGFGAWVSSLFGSAIEILKGTESEASDVVAPLVSLGEKLQFNTGRIAVWATIAALVVVLVRHIQKRIELAQAKAEAAS